MAQLSKDKPKEEEILIEVIRGQVLPRKSTIYTAGWFAYDGLVWNASTSLAAADAELRE